MRWMGVDVGGERKGFDLAVIEDADLVCLLGRLTCTGVMRVVADVTPVMIAVDSPRSCAPEGEKTRKCERAIANEICGIRWTPDASAVKASDYYAWVVQGLNLYAALDPVASKVIEVFPTASWTRWLGKKGSQSRSAWTRGGLLKLGISGVPKRTNQDQRDAIAAAFTARQHTEGTTQAFDEIVVPMAGI